LASPAISKAGYGNNKEGKLAGFTKTYKINLLVYYEDFPDMLSASRGRSG
jgi:predicted GIY-YIG superfamily endonuclease